MASCKFYPDDIIYIYGLRCPIINEIRYVGATKNIKNRMHAHLSQPKSKIGGKWDWINELKAQKLKPSVEILETTEFNKWEELEKYWIAYFRLQHTFLTNNSIGGVGSTGAKFSEIALANMKAASIGRDRDVYKRSAMSRQGIKLAGHTSDYMGVHWDEYNQLWHSSVKKEKKYYFTGRHKLEIDAAKARDKKAFELFGWDIKLNFPEDYPRKPQ